MSGALICAYLIGVEPSALSGTPLAQYQATRFEKEDTRRLMRDINRVLNSPHDEVLLRSAFDKNWISLQKKLTILLTGVKTANKSDKTDAGLHFVMNRPPSDVDSEHTLLSELEYGVLIEVGKKQLAGKHATAHEVASSLKITEEKATFFLDELSRKHRLLDWFGNMDSSIPSRYELTHEGRRLLVE
jgi:hypothetical protein